MRANVYKRTKFEALSRYLALKYSDLEVWVRGHSILLEMAPLDRSRTSSYSRSIITMTLSCIISEIKRVIGRKSRFVHTPHAFDAPCRGLRRNIAMKFRTQKLE